MSKQKVAELFAGPGGWSTGLRQAGFTGRAVGFEWDTAACETARAAGHEREQADVSELEPPEPSEKLTGVIASPPCPGFSNAGLKKGLGDIPIILDVIARSQTAEELRDSMDRLDGKMQDFRSLLVLEPLLWCLTSQPRWTAWEQVPAVQPLWDACAEALRRFGWTVDTRVLNAEQYGVPQTRQRAILVGRGPDESIRRGPAMLPTPKFSRFYSRTPDKLDPEVQRWVSMAEALGWDEENLVGFPRKYDRGEKITLNGVDYRGRDLRRAALPSFALTEKARSWQRIEFAGAGATAVRTAKQKRRKLDQPAHTITGVGSAAWCEEGTEVTLARVTVEEAGLLQTFPADYPWQGDRSTQFRQVGDAVPVLLAQRVLEELI